MTPILGIMASSISGSKTSTTSFESIATLTASGSPTNLAFTSIPQTYTHLQIRAIMRDNATGTSTIGLTATINSNTGAVYTQHLLYGTGASALAAGTASTTSLSLVNYPKAGETASAFGVMVVDILDYTNTNKYKTVRALGGYDGNNTSGIVTFRSGVYQETTAITRIDLNASTSGSWATGTTFALYGIKG